MGPEQPWGRVCEQQGHGRGAAASGRPRTTAAPRSPKGPRALWPPEPPSPIAVEQGLCCLKPQKPLRSWSWPPLMSGGTFRAVRVSLIFVLQFPRVFIFSLILLPCVPETLCCLKGWTSSITDPSKASRRVNVGLSLGCTVSAGPLVPLLLSPSWV